MLSVDKTSDSMFFYALLNLYAILNVKYFPIRGCLLNQTSLAKSNFQNQ